VPFRELPHTGDLRYEVTATTEEELFAESVRALSSTITDLAMLQEQEEREVRAEGKTASELLIDFLRACLHLFTTDGFLARAGSLSFGRSERGRMVQARLRGECFDPSRHPFRTEIKAVTYHGASVRSVREGKEWEATFTLDL
jgi:SHS2 domain-containing protein